MFFEHLTVLVEAKYCGIPHIPRFLFLVLHKGFQVNVSHKTKSRIRAFGPGLEGGIAKQPAIFYVETHGDTDQLGNLEGKYGKINYLKVSRLKALAKRQ